MRIRRLAGAVAAAAVVTPLLALTAATQATADQGGTPLPPPYSGVISRTQYEQCEAAWNVNYWSGGVAFATTQWNVCMSTPV
ncbi:hypothetical protein ACFVFS_15150 [Kitasatospora sp. NPDC057692]|uniref:hypothetical protein n=1 Tax=Kitasatospora sp. NPDC057692 TaxID=3346215 RepID=UPI0036B9E1C3